MMVSNRLTETPTQIIYAEDLRLDDTILPDAQTFEGLLPIQKQNVSIVELGRRLRKCARLGNTEQVHELMTKGAPFTTDWLGTSALHLAAMNNHLETCEVLLRAGISRDARTKVERTPLHLAAYEGHIKICELLLLNKAEVDPRDMLRMTPLHWAVEKQHDGVIELLLQHGADPTLSSKFDKTPISIAVELNRLDLAHLLQLAARLLSQQADLANTDNEADNAEATLAATQSLDLELQSQEDTDNADTTTLPVECKTELIEESQASDSAGNSIAEEISEVNQQHIEEEPAILKNMTNKASPSQLSGLQLLQAHGITMLPTDEGSLVNNAIQSGRTLVLSEAGKLVLAEGRKDIDDKSTIPIIKPAPRKQIVIPNASLKNKKVITLTPEQFMAITKSQGNKPLLKKVSAEAFKKAAETAGVKYSVIPPLKTTPVITYTGSKLKRISVSPAKDQTKTPMKVINPAALSGLLGSTKPVFNITSVKSNSGELESLRSQLKDAQAQIERLKMLLNAKDVENKKLCARLQEMKSNDNPTVD